jgi:hypothetical protein
MSRIGCITQQITSHRIAYSEFIPLAHTVTPLLPSAVSQLLLLLPFTPANAGLQLTGYSLSLVTGSLLIGSVLTTHSSNSLTNHS